MRDYLTADELRRLFPHISQDCLARSATGPVAGLPHPKREPDQRGKSQDSKLEKGEESLGYRITIISIRPRLADGHDNLRTGAKPLVDSVTAWLGFTNDADSRLQWHYEQFVGEPQSTIILIQKTNERIPTDRQFSPKIALHL